MSTAMDGAVAALPESTSNWKVLETVPDEGLCTVIPVIPGIDMKPASRTAVKLVSFCRVVLRGVSPQYATASSAKPEPVIETVKAAAVSAVNAGET